MSGYIFQNFLMDLLFALLVKSLLCLSLFLFLCLCVCARLLIAQPRCYSVRPPSGAAVHRQLRDFCIALIVCRVARQWASILTKTTNSHQKISRKLSTVLLFFRDWIIFVVNAEYWPTLLCGHYIDKWPYTPAKIFSEGFGRGL